MTLPTINNKKYNCPDCKADEGKDKCIEAEYIRRVIVARAKEADKKVKKYGKMISTNTNTSLFYEAVGARDALLALDKTITTEDLR